MENIVWILAVITGFAVVAISYLAERLGGRVGGVLAAAPITTTAALLYVTSDLDASGKADVVIGGASSLFWAMLAIPAWFHPIKWTTSKTPQLLRFVYALGAYLLVFTGGTYVTSQYLTWIPSWVWVPVTILTVLGLTFTFCMIEIPPRFLRGKVPDPSVMNYVVRFLFGAAVILIVEGAKQVSPPLAAAWTVFPGSFLATLSILFWRQGAAFSARASQGGVLGGGSVLVYLAVLYTLLVLTGADSAIAWGQVPAWLLYLVTIGVAMRYLQAKRAARTQT